jgi:hypothetical protein
LTAMTHIVPNGEPKLEALCGLVLSHHRPMYTIPSHMVKDEPLLGPVDDSDLRCPECWAIWRVWREQEREEDEAYPE